MHLTMRKRHKTFPVKNCKKGYNYKQIFWSLVKPFLAKKGFSSKKKNFFSEITLIEGNKVITSKKDLTKSFNEDYIIIVKKAVE